MLHEKVWRPKKNPKLVLKILICHLPQLESQVRQLIERQAATEERVDRLEAATARDRHGQLY